MVLVFPFSLLYVLRSLPSSSPIDDACRKKVFSVGAARPAQNAGNNLFSFSISFFPGRPPLCLKAEGSEAVAAGGRELRQ